MTREAKGPWADLRETEILVVADRLGIILSILSPSHHHHHPRPRPQAGEGELEVASWVFEARRLCY